MKEQTGSLGTAYNDGELIIRQGDLCESIFVIQEGQVEFVREQDGIEIQVLVCGQGQLVGVATLFDGGVHQFHVRALGPARLITINRKNLLRRIREDPSLALHIIEVLSDRFHKLTAQVTELTLKQRRS